MSSRESGPFKWEFILQIDCQESQARLLNLKTGAELAKSQIPPLDRVLADELIAKTKSSTESAKDLGGLLAQTVFPKPIDAVLRKSAASGPVRIGLSFSDSELSELPWEAALISGTAIGLHPNLHLNRRVGSGGRQAEPAPLAKILLVLADPQSTAYPALAGGHAEIQSLVNALTAPECRGIQVSQLRFASPASLARSMQEQAPDVLHLVCHGDVLPSGGVLVLESDRPHRESLLYADELAKMARAAGTRLIVMSGCQTAGSLASVGAALATAGVEAVVGMQWSIGDAAAHLFSRAMMATLAEGSPLEIAVDHGRAAIAGSGCGWIAPIVILSTESTLTFLGPVTAGQAPRHNIPEEDRPFVGRASEREALFQLIQMADARLITVTGMGGMGKTRLAKQVALDVLDEFRDGVRLVECEALSLEEELVAALGAAIGLESKSLNADAVLNGLKGRNMLLVFDCFERLAECAAHFPKILRSAPEVKIVVTSRVVLGVQFEREFSLDPMSLKKRRAQAADGVALFEETAAFTDPEFKVTRKNLKLVEALVRDLEAVPLAIVLAAGRLRHMSLEELAERVRSQRLDVLKRRPTGPDDRHADLLRVVGDSLGLLLEGDRKLIKCLSVFQGGFFQDDALQVLGETPDLLDGIALLRDHSLLICHLVNARMRFRILDTIREVLDRSPDDEEVVAIRARHARHFADLSANLREAFDAGRYGEAREQLSLDLGNYRVGVEWSIGANEDGFIRQYARSLARVYFETGAHREFEQLAASAEAIATGDDLPLLGELYGLKGEYFRRHGRSEAAIEVWQKRVDVFTRLGNLEGRADTLLEIARLALLTHRKDLAGTALEEFSKLKDQLADVPLIATGIALQAEELLTRDCPDEALELCRQLEERMREVRLDPQALYVWLSLARLYRSSKQFDEAERVGRRCLSDALETSVLMSAGQSLLELSRTYEGKGDAQTACRLTSIVAAIPTNVWPGVGLQLRDRTQELESAGHAALLAEIRVAQGKTDWESLARSEVGL